MLQPAKGLRVHDRRARNMALQDDISRDESDNPEKAGSKEHPERIVAAVIGASLTYEDYVRERHKSKSYMQNMEYIFRRVIGEKLANIVCMPEYIICLKLYLLLQGFIEDNKENLPGGIVVFGTHIANGYNVCPIMIYDHKSSETFFQYKNFFNQKEEEIRQEKGLGLRDYMKYAGRGELKIARTQVGNVAASICYDMYSSETKDELVKGLDFLCVPSFNDGPEFTRNFRQYIESKKCIILYANSFSDPEGQNSEFASRIFDPFDKYCEKEGKARHDLGILEEKIFHADQGQSEISFSADILSFPFLLLEEIKKIRSRRHPEE